MAHPFKGSKARILRISMSSVPWTRSDGLLTGSSSRLPSLDYRVSPRLSRGSPESMIGLVLREVAVLLAVGMALGFSVSLVAGLVVASLLFRVTPNDPKQRAGAALVLAVATAVAAYLPARR